MLCLGVFESVDGAQGAQIGDVIIEDGGMADGEAGHVLVAQELVFENARRAVVEDCERRHVAKVVIVDAQHVQKEAASASTIL